MRVRVLIFAGLRDAVGTEAVDLDVVEGLDARAFLTAFCARFPQVAPYAPSIRVAFDGRYARWDEVLVAGAEVALIPPVAGG
jgi:molybdopterin converting factor small subunit